LFFSSEETCGIIIPSVVDDNPTMSIRHAMFTSEQKVHAPDTSSLGSLKRNVLPNIGASGGSKTATKNERAQGERGERGGIDE
jgi:hypothetical protein